ncbi:MAG: PQQ-dependent sugar dehydrogenase, partial [Saprospiraceae bacterium]|nr:PQQ-dependent sugar dehydrogenase [Saprospiraceae bacterium]
MNLIKPGSLFLIIPFLFVKTYGQNFKLNPIATSFAQPVDISATGDTSDLRLFIVEKAGRIKIINMDGIVLSQSFLDIDPKVNSQANERGLLGLCFHPEYRNNGYFYVNYTNNNGNTTISRFKRSESDADKADPTSEKILLTVIQPFNNHNGGDLNFGPDGFLYIGMGDGGSGGDPGNRAQNPKELLGKMLRIDVNTEAQTYLIPQDNPYQSSVDTLQEIWAIGVRNPWRFSFDREKGDLWIADVGQDKWEEINMSSSSASGLNYGWRCYEGFVPFNTNGCGSVGKYQPPVLTYENKFDTGCSITGGYVYRGTNNSSLIGKYIYTDFCTGIFWSLYKNSNGIWQNDVLADLENNDYSTFGEDNAGELYVAGLSSGTIYKISDVISQINDTDKIEAHIHLNKNPVTDHLEWEFSSPYSGKIIWFIFDISGNLIKSLHGIKNLDTEKFSIQVAELPAGEYILKHNISTSENKKFI